MMLDLLVASQWALLPAAGTDKKDGPDLDFGVHVALRKIFFAPPDYYTTEVAV
jgi:hypothetical protein